MIEKDLKSSLSNFRDIKEAPSQRKKIRELEQKLEEKDRIITQINLNYSNKMSEQAAHINKLEKDLELEKTKNLELNNIKISVGKESLSLKEFKKRVQNEVKELKKI